MKKIGLTGGIGAGKSIVAKILATMGFPVFYSDQAGKQLMSEDQHVKQKVIDVFGEDAYKNGDLNRGLLAEKVFSDNNLKKELNNIVHPAVRKAFESWCKEQTSMIVFNEAAILFETGSYKTFDGTILVSAPESIRIERVMQRDSTTEAQVKERMRNQWSDEEKRALSDFEIINDNQHLLVPQTENIIEIIKSE